MTNGNRPYASTEPREHKYTDRQRDDDGGENRGGATVGPAGKLRRARNTSPESATDELAQAVGRRAWREDRDPADIWRELEENGRLSKGGTE